MPFTIAFSRPAARAFDRLSGDMRDRIAVQIRRLETESRPHGTTVVYGEETHAYRIRVGTYRIIYGSTTMRRSSL